ncbi:leucine-rich repeat domain-containing protein [Rickettsia endosymbiont of Orchestes rusci]|uniref:hypothetical protein n=1 Tax=Rickettsia endosymbiont of Orchestes rusci TaxID=3066250 RepID=UPI00313AAB7F
MKELIEFLEKRGLEEEADNLRNGDTHLDLYGNNIDEVGAKELAAALKSNNSLTYLNLWNNNIGDVGAKFLAAALKSNNSLTYLDLNSNNIGKVGAKELAVALKSNNSLTYLYLGGNNIGDVGAKELAAALKFNNSLTYLNLWNNSIGKVGAKELAVALKSNNSLTSLDLGRNNIGEVGGKDIVDALKENNFLTKLNLNNINISEKSTIIKSINEKIKYNNELVKKLALLLKSSFSDGSNSATIVKIASATKFYEKVNKNSLKKHLQEQKVDNPESIIIKMDNFVKTHSFTVAGVCKDIKTAFFSKYGIPSEIIDNIASYLENEKWGIEVDTLG